LKKTELEKNW